MNLHSSKRSEITASPELAWMFFTAEPLETDSPLLALDNVVLTSHIAGVTLDTWSRRIAFGFANIERVAAGQPPESVIAG